MLGLNGVHPELAYYVREADRIVRSEAPGLSLEVVSGYRSPERQAALRASWDAGNRRGLIARPALTSRHSRGLAVDLQFVWRGIRVSVSDTPRDYWRFLADLLAPVGVRWGGTFTPPDWNHYDISGDAA